MVVKKAVRRHKIHTCMTKKARRESCWAWIMQEDCVLPTKHINIFLVCFRECVWFAAVKSFRQSERKGNAEWEKREMTSIINSLSCAAVWWQVSWKPLSLSAGVMLSVRDGAVFSLLSCLGFSVFCEVQMSSSNVGRKDPRLKEGRAAACCVYTISVTFTARNQTVMCDQAHSSTSSKLSPPNNTIIVLRHNYKHKLTNHCTSPA